MAAAADRALSQRRDAAERARAAADALGAVGSGSGKAPPLDPPAASPSNGSSSAESSPQVGAWRCGLREGSPCAVLDACAPLSRLNAEALDGAADAKGSLPPLPSLQDVIQAWIVDPVLSQHRAVSRTCTRCALFVVVVGLTGAACSTWVLRGMLARKGRAWDCRGCALYA